MRSRKAQEGIQMYKPYFEPKDLTFLAAVLAQACLDAGEIDDDEREVIAARIIRLAQAGEDDFGALREYATTPDFRDEFNFLDRASALLRRRSFAMRSVRHRRVGYSNGLLT